jgi:hypothetical protein
MSSRLVSDQLAVEGWTKRGSYFRLGQSQPLLENRHCASVQLSRPLPAPVLDKDLFAGDNVLIEVATKRSFLKDLSSLLD